MPADAVQREVDAKRNTTLNNGILPRSMVVNGRFVWINLFSLMLAMMVLLVTFLSGEGLW